MMRAESQTTVVMSVLTATPLNLPMTVSSVCSYSFRRVLSCLFSCWSVWFSRTRCDANDSSSVWNTSIG